MSEQPVYKPGDQANGHVWTGSQWLPVAAAPVPAPAKTQSVWRTAGGVVALIAAILAALFAVSWLDSWMSLERDGNPFSGILALAGLGAGAVAVAFGITAVVLLTKK